MYRIYSLILYRELINEGKEEFMGQMDQKNFHLKVLIKENFIDPRIVNFVKEWNFTKKEGNAFLDSIRDTLYTPTAEKIIRFFVSYKDGMLIPDKYGAYEPLKKRFNPDDISEVIRWVSFGGGGIFLKKKGKYNAEIESDSYYTFIYDEKGNVMPPKILPKLSLGEYFGMVRFAFTKQSKPDMEFLRQLLQDFAKYINSDAACICDQETSEVLYDLYHPENNGMDSKDWNYHYKYWIKCNYSAENFANNESFQ